tara:strand:+ start:26324 stop:27601 length:1278 start_codon:yes stop_codon:yes gene_type:complete
MNKEIIINKEGDGDVFELLQESSEGSSIDVQKEIKRPIRKIGTNTKSPSAFKRPNNVSREPTRDETLQDSMFEVFTNPDKTRVQSDEECDDTHQPMMTEEDQYPDEIQSNDEDVHETFMHDDDMPSPGFDSIEDEKQDLMYKFYRMQSKGVPISRKFNIHSDIKEMRNEYQRIKRDSEVNASIRFSRRMLMACVTGIEFMNKRYDPFDVHLEGWSESVMENVSDYDNVFEKLHDKYSSKVSMAPEIELLLSLAGSAFMFHLTNTMFSNSMPNLRDIAKQNPDIIKNMMQSMQMASNPPTNKNVNEEGQKNTQNPGVREMKPPAIDLHNIISNNPFVPVGNNQFNEPTRKTDIVEPKSTPIITEINNVFSPPPSIQMSDQSEESDRVINNNTRTISMNSETQISNGGTKRKRGKKISLNSDNSITI